MIGPRLLWAVCIAAVDPTTGLVEPALAGDRRAVARLVERLMPVIRATARQVIRRAGNRRVGPYDGDDLAQEIWLRLIRDDGRLLRNFDPTRARTLEGYVAMITRTEATQLIKQERAQKRGGDAWVGDIDDARGLAGGADPEAQAMSHELAARLRTALLAALPERGRLVFAHIYVDGRSPAEAAELMRVKTQVVYNWQHKIRSIVRTQAAA